MINIVIGGSHSGKTTFVKTKFLAWQPWEEEKIDGVPVTLSGNRQVCVVGHYLKPTRTQGVDQMGRDYEKIRWKVLHFLTFQVSCFRTIALEGNALMSPVFMDAVRAAWPRQTKLWLMNPPVDVIQKRLKSTGVQYGRSIIAMSYRRAFKIFQTYREVFEHEIITQ